MTDCTNTISDFAFKCKVHVGKDLEIVGDVKEGMTAHFVDHYTDVFKHALDYKEEAQSIEVPKSEEDLLSKQ